jgi:5-methylthioadenosine/S-adenosylhomocysteine deaminase
LSVDVETNMPGDMFTQMRSVIAFQHALIFDQNLSGKENLPSFVTACDVLEFATIECARANGLADRVGTLTPGKEADIITLRTDQANIVPVNDLIGAVVWGIGTSDVDSVFVAGKALKRNGQLLNIDLDRARRLAVESRDYVVAKSGFTLPAF